MSLEPAFEAFAQAYEAGAPQVVWVRIIDDLETPVSAYLKLAHGQPYAFLFESVEGGAWRGRYSILAMRPDLVWRCRGDTAEIAEGAAIEADTFTPQAGGALDSLRDLVARSRIELPQDLPPMAAGLFGTLGYDMVRLVEPLGAAPDDPLGLPDAIMMRPSIVAVFDSIGQEIVLVTTVRPSGQSAHDAYAAARERLERVIADLNRPLQPRQSSQSHPPPPITPAKAGAQSFPERSESGTDLDPGLRRGDRGGGGDSSLTFNSPVPREAYWDIVERCKRYIEAGDIFQVVPSHRFRAPFGLDPFACYRSLRRTNPSPFLFYLNFGTFQLCGSSPEILVRLRDGKITIRPIAGTRPRGKTPEEDLALEQELLADPKERAEHLMLLDLGRNDVGRVAMLGQEGRNDEASQKGPNVRVTESFKVERYSHVMHIVSNVEGTAPEGVDPVDVLMAALPAGTLSGAPKVRAMQIIDEMETQKRGLAYAGAAGYISSNGAVDTCIVLRTALFKDGMMYVQAGGGVVADSDPDAEYEETLHKSRALRRAAEEAWRFA